MTEVAAMAMNDDSDEGAVGAEKSPNRVHAFIWATLGGIVLLLALVLLFLHFHTPVVQHSFLALMHSQIAA